MAAVEESTDELLDKYRAHQKPRDVEDITVFSDDDSIFNINKLLNNSIEYGRSSIESPIKTSSAKKYSLSPSKRPGNNYQEQLFRMRNGISDDASSPLKNRSKKNGDDSLNLDSLNESTFDNELLKDLDIRMKPEPFDESIFKLSKEEEDRTELIIRETHHLINSIPQSITSSKEGENYLKLLHTSINKLIKQLDSVKKENKLLKKEFNDIKTTKTKLKSVESKNSLLINEISSLKNGISQLNRKLNQQLPQQNSQVVREKNLLRDKLIKYKKLYEDSTIENKNLKSKLEETEKPRTHSSGAESIEENPQVKNKLSNLQYKEKLVDLYNSLSFLANNDKIELKLKELERPEPLPKPRATTHDELPSTPTVSQSNLKMLSLFEELLENMKKESRTPKGPSRQFANDSINNSCKEPSQEYRGSPRDRHQHAPQKSTEPPRESPVEGKDSSKISKDMPVENRDPPQHHKISPQKSYRELSNNLRDYNESQNDSPPPSSGDASNISASLESLNREADEHLLNKILTTMDLNNELYTNVLKLLAADKQDSPKPYPKEESTQTPDPKPKEDRNIVLKCYMCCPPNSSEKPSRKICSRCSSVNPVNSGSSPDEPKEKNDTINLMGEYKWSI